MALLIISTSSLLKHGFSCLFFEFAVQVSKIPSNLKRPPAYIQKSRANFELQLEDLD
jgi:hypothetical protein